VPLTLLTTKLRDARNGSKTLPYFSPERGHRAWRLRS
jgi:hypothetical protein